MDIKDIYTTLQSIDIAAWTSPIHDLVTTVASTTVGHVFSPGMIAQLGVGFQMGYSASQRAYDARSEYKAKDDKNFLPFLLSDFVGSPRTSPLSCLAYYVSGTLNDKWRTFFVAENIYEHVRNPIPHGPKEFIQLNNTLIPFCYPNFQEYQHSNDPYGRCYQAVYESSFTTAHRLKEPQQHVFYGSDRRQLKKHIVTESPLGTYHIETKTDLTLFERLLAQLTRHFTFSDIAEQMTAKKLSQERNIFAEDDAALIKKFQLVSFTSERQASHYTSDKIPALQLSVPQDADMNETELSSLLNFIQNRNPQRIVFHQQKSTQVGLDNAKKLAEHLNNLKASGDLSLLSSLAYHSENPQQLINNRNSFYPLFSEICTIGYNNPHAIQNDSEIGSIHKKKNKKDKRKSGYKDIKSRGIISNNIQVGESISNWSQTRVYHVSLKRPPFTWVSVPKTLFAMILHDLVYDVYGATIGAFSKTSGPFSPKDILTYLEVLLKGILASPKLAIQLLIFPIRLVFTACGAAYLYTTGQNNNLFEVGPKKTFDVALKSDKFAHTTTAEYILSYNPPTQHFSYNSDHLTDVESPASTHSAASYNTNNTHKKSQKKKKQKKPTPHNQSYRN